MPRDQTVRNAIAKFNEEGLKETLHKGSRRPYTIRAAFGEKQAENLKEMLHKSPRSFGRRNSLWTLKMAAEVGFEEGLTEKRVSRESIRATLKRIGIRWQRAKRWITSPDPAYERKRQRDRLMRMAEDNPESWVVGFLEECWWSRVALFPPSEQLLREGKAPASHSQRPVSKDEPDPKAISCYGLYLPKLQKKMWLRFVDGRPISGITSRFLRWCSEKLEVLGKKVWVLIWENASWHISAEVHAWIDAHNKAVKKSGRGVRIISCLLPTKSPWLNAIEPKWVHGKRRVVEADGQLAAYELAERVCGAFGCPHYEHLSLAEDVA